MRFVCKQGRMYNNIQITNHTISKTLHAICDRLQVFLLIYCFFFQYFVSFFGEIKNTKSLNHWLWFDSLRQVFFLDSRIWGEISNEDQPSIDYIIHYDDGSQDIIAVFHKTLAFFFCLKNASCFFFITVLGIQNIKNN